MIRIFEQFLTLLLFCALALCQTHPVYASDSSSLRDCLLKQDQRDTPFPAQHISSYQLEDSALLLRPPVGRQGFSNILFDERARAMLSAHGLVLVLSWSHVHGDEVRMAQTASHLEKLARDYGKSVWFVGWYGDTLDQRVQGASLERLKTFLQQENTAGGALDAAFYARLCAALPKDHLLLAGPQELDEQGVSTWTLHIVHHLQEEDGSSSWRQSGLIKTYLTPEQRSERHLKKKMRSQLLFAGISLLTLALLGLGFWHFRRQRPEEIWGLDEEPGEREHDAGQRLVCDEKLTELMMNEDHEAWFTQARILLSYDKEASPAQELWLECVYAREQLRHMLDTQLPLQRRARNIIYGLFRGHELLQIQSELYRKQVSCLNALLSRESFQPEERALLWRALGYGDEPAQMSGLVSTLERLQAQPVPDFDRRRAPEPWMSHVVQWFVWFDLMSVELELRLDWVQDGRASQG